MSKRGATSELTDRNWDDEEEPEEAGIFVQADQETLQQRVIKKAKRRGMGSEDGAKSSTFSGFGGLTPTFGKANTFSGFKLTTGNSGLGGNFQAAKSIGSTSLFTGASPSSAISVNGNSDSQKSGHQAGSGLDKGQGDWKDSPAYFSFLKSLNQSVLAWIKQHVEENPYIILTPIFKDYEKYLQKQQAAASSAAVHSPASTKEVPKTEDRDRATLPATAGDKSSEGLSIAAQKVSQGESSKPDKAKAEVSKVETITSVASSEVSKGFSFGTTSLSGTAAGGISFGSSTATSTSSTTPVTFGKSGFSFGATPTTTQSSGFSFGTSSTAGKPLFSFGSTSSATATSGFSFGAAASQAASSNAEANDASGKNDEEYVPPKPEVKEVKEDDALYSKRCKLYFQRKDQWVDKGVGNIHLKPVEEKKTQLLIRADTNLGNILLNVMLSASMPVSRQGKNNVLVVCVPNPPLVPNGDDSNKDKPVPMLLRVKGDEDAEELFSKIEERKALLE